MRLGALDGLRGIAAFLVVYFHATNAVENYPACRLIRASGAYGFLGVAVFFVISGFIITYSLWRSGYSFSTHWKQYLRKRLIRVMPTYLASIIVTLVLGFSVNMFYDKVVYAFNLEQLLTNILFISPFVGQEWMNPVYWSLAIEIQFYLLICFGYSLLYFAWGRWFFLSLFVFLGYMIRSPNVIFYYMPLFLIGISVSLYYTRQITVVQLLCWLAMAVGVGVIEVGVPVIVTGLMTGLFILYCIRAGFSFHKRISALGVVSYSLYLVHYPIVEKLVRAGKILGFSLVSQVLVLVVAIMASILIAWVLYLFIEMPSLRMAKRVRY
jgi:peptidoglycan/LPS O-acetylase OafA/YrhL